MVSPELAAAAMFFGGVVLVIVSVETFVESVAESATALGISGFLLTVILAGIDLENLVLGVAAVVGGLPGLALGTVFGEALFILCVAVGVAGLVTPFETTVPRTYLLLFFASPVLLFVLASDGTLTQVDGVVLTLAYVPLLAVVYRLERSTETQYLAAEATEELSEAAANGGSEEDDRRYGWYKLGLALAAVVGMTVGSELTVRGARVLAVALGITGLTFGATILSFVSSLEELFLTVAPVRRGVPHIGIGNVIGSTLFFVTANAGIIALVHPIDTSGAVFTVHWPFFVTTLVVVAVFFYRGRIKRPEGVILLGIYVAYWTANFS